MRVFSWVSFLWLVHFIALVDCTAFEVQPHEAVPNTSAAACRDGHMHMAKTWFIGQQKSRPPSLSPFAFMHDSEGFGRMGSISGPQEEASARSTAWIV